MSLLSTENIKVSKMKSNTPMPGPVEEILYPTGVSYPVDI